MPRISGIEILQRPEQLTLSIRTRTKVEELPALIGEGYGKMAAYLQELNECLAEVPFVAYHNMDMQNLDVEIGFPLAKALPAKEDMKPGAIPAGKVVTCMYQGAYQDMEPIYNEIMQWIEEKGLKPSGAFYECYYNGPESPPSNMLTRILIPVA